MVLLPDVQPQEGAAVQAQHAELDEDGGGVQPRDAAACLLPGREGFGVGSLSPGKMSRALATFWGFLCDRLGWLIVVWRSFSALWRSAFIAISNNSSSTVWYGEFA